MEDLLILGSIKSGSVTTGKGPFVNILSPGLAQRQPTGNKPQHKAQGPHTLPGRMWEFREARDPDADGNKDPQCGKMRRSAYSQHKYGEHSRILQMCRSGAQVRRSSETTATRGP